MTYLFFFYNFSLFSLSTHEELNNIPEQDKKDLEELFSYFIQRTTFSYTLFGDKPASWFVISLPEFPKIKSFKRIIYGQTEQIPLWSRWQTWKQYENKFPLKKYILIEEDDHKLPFRKDIFLINKQHFIKTVNQHIDIFHVALNRKISGEGLLQEMEHKSSFRSVLLNSDLLLGILLGFGEHNSVLYQQRENLSLLYQKYEPILSQDAPLFKKLENKMKVLTEILQPVGESRFIKVGTVQFVADLNSPQTHFLVDKYKDMREKICSLYLNGKLLDITLMYLTK